MPLYVTSCFVALAGMILVAAAPVAESTPAATTSSSCPQTATDTSKFLAAQTIAVRAPSGSLALVPVRDYDSRSRGLMCVVRVPTGKGMIFVFPPPDRLQNFWMKDTLVALDMIFVSATGTVTGVAANVPATPAGTPDDKIVHRTGEGRFVIELGAGDAARQGITAGTKLALPPLTAQE